MPMDLFKLWWDECFDYIGDDIEGYFGEEE